MDRLGIDSAAVIYFIEEHPRYLELLDRVFERVDAGAISGVTSTITLAEVLTHPIKRGDDRLKNSYVELMLEAANFTTAVITPSIAIRAAELRSRHGIRTPDAVQLACAIEHGCQAFLTNDRRLRVVSEIRVIVLDLLLAASDG